jgi:hypothetical protein
MYLLARPQRAGSPRLSDGIDELPKGNCGKTVSFLKSYSSRTRRSTNACEIKSRAFLSSLRDGFVFCFISQHFVLGYFHSVPPGHHGASIKAIVKVASDFSALITKSVDEAGWCETLLGVVARNVGAAGERCGSGSKRRVVAIGFFAVVENKAAGASRR